MALAASGYGDRNHYGRFYNRSDTTTGDFREQTRRNVAAYSDGALADVPDLARVVRQVHRVLVPDAPFVFSCPHPLALCLAAPACAFDFQPYGRGAFAEIVKAHAGRPLIVHFWSVTCPPCLVELPQ